MNNKQEETIYYGKVKHEQWIIYIAATNKGLCFVGSPNKGIEELQIWADKNRTGSKLIESEKQVRRYTQQIKEYLNWERKEFNISIDLKGTAFQESVWKELQNIRYGEIVSYSTIADKIGNSKAVRAVGAAIGANPVMIVVPCHRVVSKNGKLTGFRGGLEMKKALLTVEESNKTGA